MRKEIVLDVRGLEPPEPLEIVLDAIVTLQSGERVRMIVHRDPYPLYPLLAQQGFQHIADVASDDHYEILIWRKGDAEAAPYGLAQ